MSDLLYSMRNARLQIGGKQLFNGLDLDLKRGERVCLVGRNGAGKSTLMKVLAGQADLDSGHAQTYQGAIVQYLPQEPKLAGATVRDYLKACLEKSQAAESAEHLIDQAIADTGLSGEASTKELSGGERRKLSITGALLHDCDILLLDEPTNHLDLRAIEWLEGQIAQFPGALVMISHDRRFLINMSRSIWWLENGLLRYHSRGFSEFESWRDAIYEAEEKEIERLSQKIKAEMRWLERGVTARRKRNVGRLTRLPELRKKRASLREKQGDIKLTGVYDKNQSTLIVEAQNISKSYGAREIVKDFSTRIIKGDRVGIIGANGSGKTTLLKMFLKELEPDDGRIKIGESLKIATFDQHKSDIKDGMTPWQVMCPDGGDQVIVHGKARHVAGYLKDFLFQSDQLRQPVSALSGGEKSRLLLAKIFTKPANVLVLDEPTNDLDMETLDLLEENLAEFEGSVILISHDRMFLDNLVTSTIAFEGSGFWQEYPGGYSDYQRQTNKPVPTDKKKAPSPKSVSPSAKYGNIDRQLERELMRLPDKIERQEQVIAKLELELSKVAPHDAAALLDLSQKMEAEQKRLDEMELRWLELEEQREVGIKKTD